MVATDWRFAGLLAAGIVLTACGGGGGGGGGSEPPANKPPVADAGADAAAFRNEVVMLDASHSVDPENGALSYKWTQIAGPIVSLANSSASRSSFTAPQISGVLTFEVTVTDAQNASSKDAITITVVNRVPQVNAGPDKVARFGEKVRLDVQGSDPDGDTLSYTWRQLSGPTSPVEQDTQGVFSLAGANQPSVRVYGVTASDAELSSAEDTVVVAVSKDGTNAPPLTDAGVDLVRPRNALVSLSGFALDPNGHAVSVKWEQVAGPSVALANASTLNPTFNAPNSPAELTFRLTATDGVLIAPADEVTVTVRNYAPVITNAALTPAAPNVTDEITATATVHDADGDAVAVTYQWRRNGVVIPGQGSERLPAFTAVKGDHLLVDITADDGFERTVETRGAWIANAPPVIAGEPPPQAIHGEPFVFRPDALDPDGGSPFFYLDHGPAGMQVNEDTGEVTWTPTQPMFTRSQTISWALVAGDGESDPQRLEYTTELVDDARSFPLRRTGFELPTRDYGMQIVDMNGDGRAELLFSTDDNVYEMSYADGQYAQSWAYPFRFDGYGPRPMTTADDDGDGQREIYVATTDRVLVMDGATRLIKREMYPLNGDRCTYLETADLDSDGDAELICAAQSVYASPGPRVVVFSAQGAILWSSPYGGTVTEVAVANMDNDAALEIATLGGQVYDGVTGALQWDYGALFGTSIDVGDVTGDGQAEILALRIDTDVRAYQVSSHSVVWSFNNHLPRLMKAVDMQGDGIAEVMIAEADGNMLAVYRRDSSTGAAESVLRLPNYGGSVAAMGQGDTDDDPHRELIYAASYAATGGHKLVVIDPEPAPAVEWTNSNPETLSPPYLGAMLAQRAPGQPRLVYAVAQSNNYRSLTRLVTLNPQTGALSTSPPIGQHTSQNFALDIVDADSDGTHEVIAATADANGGYLAAYDLLSATIEDRTTSISGSGSGVATTRFDFTEDGVAEVIVLDEGGRIRVYDPIQRVVLWTSTEAVPGPADVEVYDVTYDGVPEIVVGGSNGLTVYVMETPTSFSIGLVRGMSAVKDLLVADTDEDQNFGPELYVLTGQSILQFGVMLEPLQHPYYPIWGPAGALSLHLEDLGFGRKNLLVSTDGSYVGTVAGMVCIDPRNGREVWRSPWVGYVPRNSLHYIDVGSDGRREIAFGSSQGMYVTR